MEAINLNRQQRGCLTTVAIVLIFLALAFAGRSDYNEKVISEMGCQTYRAIKAELGDRATETDIVEAYMADRERWGGKAARYNPPRGASE